MAPINATPQIEMSPITKKNVSRTLLKNAYINPVRLDDIRHIVDEFDETKEPLTKIRPDSSFFNTKSVIPKEWPPEFPFLYKFSSFFYAASAIHEIYVNQTIGLYSKFAPFEAPLLLIQAMLSYLSDTVFAGESSVFHLLDRICATALTSWFLSKAFYLEFDTVEIMICSSAFSMAFVCFYLCRLTLQKEKFKGFVVCKILWHLLLPLGGSVWLAYRMGQFEAM